MIDVLYYSCPYDLSGYGSVSRNHLVGLSRYKDIKLKLRSRKFWRGPSPSLGDVEKKLKELEAAPIANNNFIFVQHLTPENFFVDPRAAYHVCYTPFETDGAPISWLLGLKAMDEIWVPSKENKKSYINMNIDSEKIKVIPHGVDTEKYNVDVEPLKYERAKFNFGSVFDWTERKNPVSLIRAYYNAFRKDEDVSLTLRVFWKFPVEKTMEHVKNEIKKIKESFKDRTNFPRIILWTEVLPDDALPNLYKSFDCFVLPTRGEGFGLPLIEAMACGVPTIGPAWGGNTDFMRSDNSFLVPGSMIPVNDTEFLRVQPHYGGQNWFGVDEGEFSKTMRWVYDNKDKAMEMGRFAAKEIADGWTWKHTAEKIHDAIIDIDRRLRAPKNIKNDMSFMEDINAKSSS